MENAEFVNIFQAFDFPTALCIVSLCAFAWIAKRFLEVSKEWKEESIKLRDHYIGYLQQNQVEISGAIIENAAAAKEYASALKETMTSINRFSLILERLEKKLGIVKEE